jgi:high-affinity nickel permease
MDEFNGKPEEKKPEVTVEPAKKDSYDPIKALVWGIVVLVVSVLSLFVILSMLRMFVTYQYEIQNTASENTEALRESYMLSLISSGIFAILNGIGDLIMWSCTKHLYKAESGDGRYQAGKTTRQIGFIFAIVMTSLAILATVLLTVAIGLLR